MTKSKNDIESLFGKLLGSANSFNTINTFNENAKDIFKNKNFKIEDLGDKFNDAINNIGNVIDNNVKDVKDRVFEKEINKNLEIEEIKTSQEEIQQYSELKEHISKEISNAAKNISHILHEDDDEFNLSKITKSLDAKKLKEAIIFSEILGKPVSKRRRKRGYR